MILKKRLSSVDIGESRLDYATTLINGLKREGTNMTVLHKALRIMQFGGISIQDMLYYLEATEFGGGRG